MTIFVNIFLQIMRISEEKINEILNTADIVDLISGYIHLKKRGRNYIGLCPFHQEKTPSFTVSSDKQIFHCFGCHAGGNVFKFLMDYKSISFNEAAEEIARQYGVKIESEQGYFVENQTETELLYEINTFAARYFSDNLLNSPAGEVSREYLKKRKIKLQTQRAFGIGYALPGWDNFLTHARSNKIDLEKAKTIGLLDKKESGDYYDKFRGRVIFPIFSPNGRVIAFGGRILENNDNVAKYLNSPESEIYSKRKTLYGLYHSKDEIRSLNKVILVEGYMDLISLFQHGVKNVVASSGTALTEDQIKLLSRYTKTIIVLFDSDTAGEKAALRSIELLLKQDFDVKILSLPKGEDPDSFIHKNGLEVFSEQIEKAEHFLEYQVSYLMSKIDKNDALKQSEVIRELVKTAALVKDDLKRSLLIKSISRKFNLREKLIESEMLKYTSASNQRNERVQANEKEAKAPTISINSLKTENPREKEIFSLLFEGDENIIGYIFDNIMPDDFSNPVFVNIAEQIFKEFKNKNFKASILIDKIEDETIKNMIIKQSVINHDISRKWDTVGAIIDDKKILYKYTDDVIKAYKIYNIDIMIRNNNKAIHDCTNENDLIELFKINQELQEEKKVIIQSQPFFKI